MNKKTLIQSSIVFSVGVISGFIASKMLEKTVGELSVVYDTTYDKPTDMLLVLNTDKSLSYNKTGKYIKLKVSKKIQDNSKPLPDA